MTQPEQDKVQFNYFFGLLNAVAAFLLVWLFWYIFMAPDGIMGLYTPMYGFSLVVTAVAVVLMIIEIANFYPFPEKGSSSSPLLQGIVLTVMAGAVTLIVYYFIFWGFIGKYGIAYFSPQSIIASGGTGAELFPARENASLAIVYFFTGFIWMTLFWKTGFVDWPWQHNERGTAAFSRLFAIVFFSVIIFAVLFHPHVCHLFYPAQDKAGVYPWWTDFAGTSSAFFSLGIILCTIFWLVCFGFLWEGRPFSLFETSRHGNLWRGIVVFVSSVIFGVLMVYILTRIMNQVWDTPFMGGQYTDAPDYRFLHSAEIASFFILAAFLLKHYFNNFPNAGPATARAVARTGLAIIGGLLLYLFYYSSFSNIIFGRVPGYGQPEDTPIVWIFMFAVIILIQMEFFKGWPLKKVAGN